MKPENLEVEIKWEFDAAGYDRIIDFFSGLLSAPRHQKNTFFDSEHRLLLESFRVLRIREEDSKVFIALKGKASVSGSVHSREENEAEIPAESAQRLMSGFKLSECGLPRAGMLAIELGDLFVSPFLSFQNTRIDIPWHGRILEIDCFDINGRLFYELEAEADSKSIRALEEELKRLFRTNNWGFSPSGMSKFHRACLLNNIDINKTGI